MRFLLFLFPILKCRKMLNLMFDTISERASKSNDMFLCISMTKNWTFGNMKGCHIRMHSKTHLALTRTIHWKTNGKKVKCTFSIDLTHNMSDPEVETYLRSPCQEKNIHDVELKMCFNTVDMTKLSLNSPNYVHIICWKFCASLQMQTKLIILSVLCALPTAR